MAIGWISLKTTLTVDRCAEVFHQVGDPRRRGSARSEASEAEPRDQVDGDPPQLGACHGAPGPVRMTAWDRGRYREVELTVLGHPGAHGRTAIEVLDVYIMGFREAELAAEPPPPDPAADPRLPEATLGLMARYGRHELRRSAKPDERMAVLAETQEPMAVAAAEDPDRFVAALAEACLPAGGWAVYGAERTVVNLLGSQRTDDAWFRLLDASIAFLRANYVPLARIPVYAVERFLAQGGAVEDWLPFREPPDPNATVITPLADGETRCVVRGGASPASSSVLVARRGPVFVARIVVEWDTDDGAAPARDEAAEIEWKQAYDLYDLYLDIAWSIPTWEWAHDELEPFFPAPQARI